MKASSSDTSFASTQIFRKFFSAASRAASTEAAAPSPAFNPPRFTFARDFASVEMPPAPAHAPEAVDGSPDTGACTAGADPGSASTAPGLRALDAPAAPPNAHVHALYEELLARQQSAFAHELAQFTALARRQAAVMLATQHSLDLALLSLDEKIGTQTSIYCRWTKLTHPVYALAEMHNVHLGLLLADPDAAGDASQLGH